MIRRFAVVGLASTMCLMTACSSSGNGNNKSSAAPSPTTSSKTSQPVLTPTDLPTKPSNDTTVRKDAVGGIQSCLSTKTGWSAGGTLKNDRTTAFTYALTVYFTTSSATVVAFGTTRVTVPAGQTSKWTVTKDFTAPQNTKCVLVGVAKA